MVVQLAYFRSDFANLPSLEAIPRVENGTMLLLEFPQLGVDVKGPTEISLPLFVAVLRQVTEPVEQLLRLFKEVAKLTDNFSLVFRHD